MPGRLHRSGVLRHDDGRGRRLTDLLAAAGEIAVRAELDLAELVGISSPSGDVQAAEAAVAVLAGMLPGGAQLCRLACSSPDHGLDALALLRGSGSGRLLLLGHLDTVIGHARHEPLRREGDRLTGSGSIDMKAGVVLAAGILRALAARPHTFAEAALLCVVDEEWRTAPFVHADRFRGWDACLCFEAGARTAGGQDAVVVRRKAAGTLLVEARGRASHSGSAPERGRNALLALAHVARMVGAEHHPDGPETLTAVPTILRSGDAFNVVPAGGELFCDLRAHDAGAFARVQAAVPGEFDGVELSARLLRLWPGMDAESATAGLLAAAADRLGRPILAGARGGASDASHISTVVPVTVDGLGPLGGGAHAPGEYVLAGSLQPRAELALALTAVVLGD